MVSFKVLISVLALAAPIAAQATPAQILSDINLLTTKTQALQPKAQSISLVNGPLVIVGLGPFPDIIRGYTDIVNTATNSINQLQSTATIPAGADADAISTAWTRFATTQENLANILTGKAGLFNTVPLIGQPVAAVLRQDERIVDTYGLTLAGKVPSHAADINTQTSAATSAIDTAITANDGLSLKKRSMRFGRREAVSAA